MQTAHTGNRANVLRTQDTDDEVERRRKALRKVLGAADMTPAHAAKAAGLPSANALYNFLNDRSNSLSQATLEKLAQVIPGATLATLSGLEEMAAPGAATRSAVVVRMAARAGNERPTTDLPHDEQFELPAPVRRDYLARGAFGVLVRGPGFEQLYPDGTVLICLSREAYSGKLAAGRRVILHRLAHERTEITVRELRVWRDGIWLWPRTDHPRHQHPVMMPALEQSRWQEGESEYVVAAVVLVAICPEEDRALR